MPTFMFFYKGEILARFEGANENMFRAELRKLMMRIEEDQPKKYAQFQPDKKKPVLYESVTQIEQMKAKILELTKKVGSVSM